MTPYYQDAQVALYHADSFEAVPALVVQAGLPGSVLTDPSYGVDVHTNNRGRFELGDRNWSVEVPDPAMLVALGVPTIIWGGNYFTLPVSGAWLVWDKQNDGMSYANCELAWTNLPQPVRIIRLRWAGAHAREKREERLHPTQKPVRLMSWCLSFLPEDGEVWDPFCGSGTTLVAAKAAGRRAVGIEIEERYCEIAADRLRQETLGLVAPVAAPVAAQMTWEDA